MNAFRNCFVSSALHFTFIGLQQQWHHFIHAIASSYPMGQAHRVWRLRGAHFIFNTRCDAVILLIVHRIGAFLFFLLWMRTKGVRYLCFECNQMKRQNCSSLVTVDSCHTVEMAFRVHVSSGVVFANKKKKKHHRSISCRWNGISPSVHTIDNWWAHNEWTFAAIQW